MSWTEDRVEILKKLWGDGRTAAEIAKELGGVTRNAVIGKAHRLKLSNRVSPIQSNSKKPAVVASNNNLAAPKKAAVKAAPVAAAATSVAKPVEKAQPLKPVISEGDAKRKRYALTALKPGMCRWPIGDPRDENFGFCGCKITTPGSSYCDEHAAVAYQTARTRTLKAEDFEKAEEEAARKMATE